MTRPCALCALALVVVGAACAQPKRPPGDDLEGKPWEAQKALLPPYPGQAGPIPLYVSPAVPFAFSVDPASVSVGQDGVVRYTLIARGSSTATNVSYEGIRCETYERRVYAFGRSDGAWAQARNSQWAPITRMSANPQAALAKDFFCPEWGPVQTTDEALRALARGNQPR